MRGHSWISVLAYEARIRHIADCRQEVVAAEQLAAVGWRILAELRLAVLMDLEGFLAANADSPEILVTCFNGRTAQGFVVSRSDRGCVTRRLTVEPGAGTLDCCYSAGGGDGSSVGRMLTIGIAGDAASFSLWDEGLEHRFATVDAISSFLLAPMCSEA